MQKRFFLALFIAQLAAACAPVTQGPQVSASAAADEARKQQALAMREYLRQQGRLSTVSHRVRVAGVSLCQNDLSALIGMESMSLSLATKDIAREVAARDYGVGEKPTVLFVVPGSPADLAGLKPGDRWFSIDGEPVADGTAGSQFIGDKMKAAKGAMTVRVQRQGGEVALSMTPVQACAWSVRLAGGDQVNAFADGNKVSVTIGMMRFIQSDDELALIVGHEMAHNRMAHLNKKLGNRILGALAGAVIDGLTGGGGNFAQLGADIGERAYSQDFEAEADYVGVYYAAMAGYDVKGAADLWRRIAMTNPAAIHLAGTSHPSTAIRFLAIQKAADEVADRKAAGQILEPTLKQSANASDPPPTIIQQQ